MKCYISDEEKKENNRINKVRKIIEKNVKANINTTDKNDSGNKNRNKREIIIVQRIKQNDSNM